MAVEFHSEWGDGRLFDIGCNELCRLGKLLLSLAARKRSSFCISVGGEDGLTVEGKGAFWRKQPRLTFSYTGMHRHFEKPCRNTFYYDGFTRSEIKSFAKELIEFKNKKVAAIGDTEGVLQI